MAVQTTVNPASYSTTSVPYQGSDANFRNLNDTQTAVKDRVPLKIDNLKTQGAFNNLSPTLWDASNSRIKASNLEQKFSCRLILEVTPTVSNSVLTLDVDISAPNATNPVLIYSDSIPLFKLDKTTYTRFFPFYISQTFMNNGALICVSATDPVAITNASLYLKLTGGTP